ncbi:hypothetical protein G7Y79_00077g099660 [Physcia stellaris]|nr:hypothetical protein G7Y79_00077g099660 [Physcia stellaris]
MKSLLLSLVGYSLLSPIIADYIPKFSPYPSYYFLRFRLPAGGDQQFTELSGEMIAPKYLSPYGGSYNIWPGLETGNRDGVIKNLLNNEGDGTWTYWSWHSPGFPWNDNQDAHEGDTLLFSTVKRDTSWYTTQANLATGESSSHSLDELTGKTFTSAFFTFELYDVQWDFGPMTWNNIVIRSTGTDASWCNDKPENWADGARYTISGLSSTVDDGGVTCYIGSLVMNFPLKPATSDQE